VISEVESYEPVLSISPDQPAPSTDSKLAQPDYTIENGLLVFTAAYHLKRGSCCGSGCRHCPYSPQHTAGTTQVSR
jgi:hypothetical protein